MAASVTVFRVLSLLLVLTENDLIQADFGLPVPINNGNAINASAKGVNNALNSLVANYRRNNWKGQMEQFRSSSETIAQIANKLTDLGRYVTGNVSKVANDKSTSPRQLFINLHRSFEGMSSFLKTDIVDSMEALNSNLGYSLTMELVQALSGVNNAVVNASSATENFEQAVDKTIQAANGRPVSKRLVNAYVSLDLTSSMSKALTDMREQTLSLSRVIESTLKNIAYIDSYLTRVNSTGMATEQKLNSTELTLYSWISAERDNVLKRYYASQFGIRSELSSAVGKMSVFNSNHTLQVLSEKYSEAYTKIYYYLYQRNKTETSTIIDLFDEINSNISRQIHDLQGNFSLDLHQEATKLGIVYLSRSESSESCYKKLENQAFNIYSTYSAGFQNCMIKEKNRLVKIPDAVDRILRLMETNTQDFATNIGTCLAYSNYASSPLVFDQAQACLHTNLNQMENYQDIVAQEYDTMIQACSLEATGIKFRVGNCLATRANETQAMIDNLNAEIDLCVGEQQQLRRIFAGAVEDDDGEDDQVSTTTVEPEQVTEIISTTVAMEDEESTTLLDITTAEGGFVDGVTEKVDE